MSNTLRSGETRELAIPSGGSIAISSIAGTVTADVVAGTAKGTNLLSASTGGGTFGPYASGAVVRVTAGVGAIVDYDIGTAPANSYEQNAKLAFAADGTVAGIADPVSGGVVGLGGQYPKLQAIAGVVAFWDFTESRAPYVSKIGAPFQLVNGVVSKVKKSNGGPLAHSVTFDGVKDYLSLPASEIGGLNVGSSTGKVFVLAFVKRADSSAAGCVAGVWREDDGDPRRQYALFVDLPVYGGDNKVCFHVSRTGGASPNIPFSRDYSANGSAEPNRDWVCVSGSYDGQAARSYIEGRFEPFAAYTEPGAPNGEGLTYDKNPYAFTNGLNNVAAEFTVGACKLTSGFGNFFAGEIAALLVMNRAPSLSEISAIQEAISTSGWGSKNRLAQWDGTVTGVSTLTGCNAYRGATALVESASASGVFLRTQTGSPAQMFVYRSNTSGAGVAAFTVESIAEGFTSDNLLSASFRMANANTGDAVRLMVKVGSSWYATEATYSVAAASASGGDWSLAETKTVNFEKTAALWRDVTLTPTVSLSLAGAARSTNLPSGAITGYGIYSAAVPTGNVRFRDFEIIKV